MVARECKSLPARIGLAAFSVWVVGCFNPKLQEGIACSDEGECPPGQVCDTSRNQCVSERGESVDGGGGQGDGGGDPDGGDTGSTDARGGDDQERDLDLIFVIDDSSSMAANQESLINNFSRFVDVLGSIEGGLPNIHIGVISSDVGADPTPLGHDFVSPECTGEGHEGRFIVGAQDTGCSGIEGQWLVDKVDEDGDPIRNYDGDLAEQFTCMASLGVQGCGFEQHLEALRRALEHPDNQDFFRDEAHLGVVILSDEDDCSVHDLNMFGGEPFQSLEEELGPLDSFRCTDFGVQCDPVDCAQYPGEMRCEGARQNCVPRQNSPYMHPPEHYAEILADFKGDPNKVIVATIIGNPEPLSVFHQAGDNVVRAKLAPSCDSSAGDADPGVRLNAFVNQFPSGQTENTSICDGDLSGPIGRIAQRFAAALDET